MSYQDTVSCANEYCGNFVEYDEPFRSCPCQQHCFKICQSCADDPDYEFVVTHWSEGARGLGATPGECHLEVKLRNESE
jgi:hypothetical protein